MKTKKILALILILVGLGFSFKAEAQCDVYVTNTTGCDYYVDVIHTGGSTGTQLISSGVGPVQVSVSGGGTTCLVVLSIDVYDGNIANPVNLQPAGVVQVNHSCTTPPGTDLAVLVSQTSSRIDVSIF